MPMTAAEQYIFELVNRARLDPAGEAARLGIDLNEGLAPGTISAAPKDPYAPSTFLQTAARGHSAFMDAVDKMAHSGIGDLTDIERMKNAGYTPVGTTYYGENIAWTGTSGAVNEGALAYQNYANLFIDSFASDRGHRLNMLSETFREMGVGSVVGTMGGYNAAILTQDFGARGTDRFITGVAYNDLNGNLFYDIGEGRGGVSVSVGAGTGATEAAGGYAVAYAGGTVLVTFSGGGLPASIGVTVAGGSHSVKVDLIGTATVAVSQSATLGANAANLVLLGIESLNGTGNGLANTITGNNAGNHIDGAGGADVLVGRGGSDTYYVDNAGDVVVEAGYQGNDLVIASVSASLSGSVERMTLAGSANINATGNGLDNVLTGNIGANAIFGGAGIDTMIGKAGSDTYYVDNVADVVIEAGFEGNDLIVASVSYGLGGSLERLTLSGSGNTTATGNGLDNVLTGNIGANAIIGGAGFDTMIGKAGSDTYYVDNVGDVVIEAGFEGNDLIVASVSYGLGGSIERLTLSGSGNTIATGNGLDNVLTGNIGGNLLYGLGGNDSLNGGAGGDRMFGGAGRDVMAGGSANDRFVFSALAESVATTAGRDLITDFQPTFDDIDLSGIDARASLANNNAFAFIGTSAFTAEGQLRFRYEGSNTIVEGDTNGDARADFQIELAGKLALGASDFVL